MKTDRDLLDAAQKAGYTLSVEDGGLCCHPPLHGPLRKLIIANQASLIDLLLWNEKTERLPQPRSNAPPSSGKEWMLPRYPVDMSHLENSGGALDGRRLGRGGRGRPFDVGNDDGESSGYD